ncbi:MAG: serpin family protein [Ruminococcaceae bacterium]|nr:serpin family protein [Oscillospiraceae bacterium]
MLRLRAKLACALLAVIILTSSVLYGCNSPSTPNVPEPDGETVGYNRLTEHVSPVPIPERLPDEVFYEAVKGFSSKIMMKSIHGTDNVALSPLALMNSLLLMSNGSSPMTADEIIGLFSKKITQTQFNEYMATYVTALKLESDFGLSSSFWINQRSTSFTPNPTFLQLNANYYLADGFSYDGAIYNSTQIINSWLKNNSELYSLSLGFSSVPNNSSITTLSGIHGKMDWETPFKSTQKGIFRSPEAEKEVVYMSSEETQLIHLGNSSGFVKSLTNGCKVAAIIPNENVKLSAVIEFIDLIGISNIIDYTHTVSPFTVLIPEFTYQKITDCTEILSKCGLSRAFSVEQSGFSSISETPVPLYISEIYSAVSLSFGESGMIAGGTPAASSVPSSAEETPLTADVLYNHPFVYIVYDQHNVPLFIGNVVNP